MGKYYIDNDPDEKVDVVAFAADDEEYTITGGVCVFIFSDGHDSINFYKSDIDKMIALFQAAKDKLCN